MGLPSTTVWLVSNPPAVGCHAVGSRRSALARACRRWVVTRRLGTRGPRLPAALLAWIPKLAAGRVGVADGVHPGCASATAQDGLTYAFQGRLYRTRSTWMTSLPFGGDHAALVPCLRREARLEAGTGRGCSRQTQRLDGVRVGQTACCPESFQIQDAYPDGLALDPFTPGGSCHATVAPAQASNWLSLPSPRQAH